MKRLTMVKTLKWFAFLFVLPLLGLLMLYWINDQALFWANGLNSGVNAVSSFLARYHWPLSVLRWGVLGVVFYYWPQIVKFIADEDKEKAAYLMASKLKLFVVFLGVELLACQGLWGRFGSFLGV